MAPPMDSISGAPRIDPAHSPIINPAGRGGRQLTARCSTVGIPLCRDGVAFLSEHGPNTAGDAESSRRRVEPRRCSADGAFSGARGRCKFTAALTGDRPETAGWHTAEQKGATGSGGTTMNGHQRPGPVNNCYSRSWTVSSGQGRSAVVKTGQGRSGAVSRSCLYQRVPRHAAFSSTPPLAVRGRRRRAPDDCATSATAAPSPPHSDISALGSAGAAHAERRRRAD